MINNRLMSFSVSLMLSSAFLTTTPEGIISAAAGPAVASQAIANALNGLRGSDWHGTADIAMPAPVNAPMTVAMADQRNSLGISEAQLRKVLRSLANMGQDRAIHKQVANILGFSKNGETVWARNLGIEDDNGVMYGIGLLKDGSGYMFDVGISKTNRTCFRLDENLRIIAAFTQRSADDITILSPSDAETRLRKVMAVWAEYADQA